MFKSSMLLALASLFSAVQAQEVSQDLIAQGEYLAHASDCSACHTAPGGQAFAGGLMMPTPVGNIYTTNITPDPETGIGNYTLADFSKAVRQGQSPAGHLYPAMPYTAYAKMPDEDIAALFAYFKHGVEPVSQPNKVADITWPLNMRWPLSMWQALFLDSKVYENEAEQSAQWNRGAYLVQGPGHCGMCHTPRGLAFQEKALDEQSEQFLSGAELGGWWATSLRGDWKTGIGALSAPEIAELLRTGYGGQVAVSGSMSEVIEHSTQYLTDEDRLAVAVYLKSLSAMPEVLVTQVNERIYNGGELYDEYCSSCHGANGNGYAGSIPALAGNSTLNVDTPNTALRVILYGSISPAVGPAHTQRLMPGYGWQLNDRQVAELTTFMRSRWGNNAAPVMAKDVARQRAAEE